MTGRKLKKQIRSFSRRRFLTVGSLSVAGAWAAYANESGVNAVRNIIDDTRREIASPSLTPAPESWEQNALTAAWLGHSTVLINFFGVNILTDPVLFKRIGANTALGTVGPKRLIAPPLAPWQLPPIDLVLISHAHMDHLDPASLKSLPGRPKAVTAVSTTDLLQDSAIAQARAIGWDEQTRVRTRNGDVNVRAFEVRHWGARWRYDTYRGYNGYVVEREGRKLIFGGDTAMCDSFRNLRKFGPFDLAIMPIGSYEPWIRAHCNPEQAVAMSNNAGATYVLPIHHKTFPLGRESRSEPIERLQATIEAERIGWSDVGETFRLPA